MELIIKQKLVNLNYQNNRFIVKITKIECLDQDAGDVPRTNHYQSLICCTIWLYPTWNWQSSSWVLMDLNTSEQNVTAGSVLKPGLQELWKFMFSDRYQLTASTLVCVCPSMTGVMLWIASFNRWKASLFVVAVECLPEGEDCVI